ncbi:hypothetical protein JIN77_00595 [Verrucomicrobiaceae bacterium R5-34]|nr:hypothetical protein [Verrucomicrobiaceae bacterium R5-34]
MKTTPLKITPSKLAAMGLPALAIGLSLICASCGAPDPTVQKEMDQDIMSAAEKKGPGSTVGPKYMQSSQGYGLGGY